MKQVSQQTTERCRFNVDNSFPNPLTHKIHPIVRLLGWGMECILWVQTNYDLYSASVTDSLQRCRQYHIILDCIITRSTVVWMSKHKIGETPQLNYCSYIVLWQSARKQTSKQNQSTSKGARDTREWKILYRRRKNTHCVFCSIPLWMTMKRKKWKKPIKIIRCFLAYM